MAEQAPWANVGIHKRLAEQFHRMRHTKKVLDGDVVGVSPLLTPSKSTLAAAGDDLLT